MAEGQKKNLSRRTFAKVTALGVGGVAFAGLDPTKLMAKVPDKWDLDVDVVVVGAGGAGLAAAAIISAAGKSVIVLEKTPAMGGSSLICGGALSFAGTDMQAAENIKDSKELLYKDLMSVGENMNTPSLVKVYVDNQLETYEWLKQIGIKFKMVGIASGMSVPRAHYVTPSDVIKTLSDMAKAKGAKILTGTAATRLVQNDKGQICGVLAERSSRKLSYGARSGVILTSGGFSLNKELLAKFVPPMAKAKAIVGRGCQGDGLNMAWAYGADIRDTPYLKATFGFSLNAETINDSYQFFYHGGIIVNKEGRRFVNESKSYKLIGDAALVQTDAVGIQVFDSAAWDSAASKELRLITALQQKGVIYSAPTLQELAEKCGIPVSVLEETVREYNANVAKGVDPQFGRVTLAAAYGKPVKIEKPPFYSYPSTAFILGTYGGVLINDKTQVVDVFGNVIPRLFAAGEVIGGVHGAAYMTGTAFGKALIFGRIAGKTVLA
jgi:fumarate reductase flavoprotein subunit